MAIILEKVLIHLKKEIDSCLMLLIKNTSIIGRGIFIIFLVYLPFIPAKVLTVRKMIDKSNHGPRFLM